MIVACSQCLLSLIMPIMSTFMRAPCRDGVCWAGITSLMIITLTDIFPPLLLEVHARLPPLYSCAPCTQLPFLAINSPPALYSYKHQRLSGSCIYSYPLVPAYHTILNKLTVQSPTPLHAFDLIRVISKTPHPTTEGNNASIFSSSYRLGILPIYPSVPEQHKT